MWIPLESRRLNFKPLEHSDIPEIHLLNSFEEVARFNTIGVPGNLKVTEDLFAPILSNDNRSNPQKLIWVLSDKNTNVFIGEVGMNLYPERYKRAEIHYSILPEFWGQGYATEACTKLLSYGFNDLKFHRMEAGVAVGNEASIRVLEKIGMLREGTCRKILPLKSGWSDNYQYAILETDYFNLP